MSAAHPSASLYWENSGGDGAAGAPPLVLLHGWGMNLRVFDGLREALGSEQPVTAIDLPGHGRSPWNPQASPHQQLAALAAVLPRGATLLGWSLGGQLALQLANDPALAVRALVLIATSPRFLHAPDWPHGLPAETVRQFASQLEADPDQAIADFLELQVRGSADATSVRSTLHGALRRHGAARREALTAGLALLEHNDLRELARQTQIPALLIAGQQDRVTPPQAAQALAQLLPHAKLLQLRRAGHAPFISHPEQVSAALHGFLHRGAHQRHDADSRLAP